MYLQLTNTVITLGLAMIWRHNDGLNMAIKLALLVVGILNLVTLLK